MLTKLTNVSMLVIIALLLAISAQAAPAMQQPIEPAPILNDCQDLANYQADLQPARPTITTEATTYLNNCQDLADFQAGLQPAQSVVAPASEPAGPSVQPIRLNDCQNLADYQNAQ